MTSTQRPARTWQVFGFAVIVGGCLAVGALGGAITSTSVDTWYQTLTRPWFNPPDWVFAPVWTTLYVMIGIACWLVWRSCAPNRAPALAMFALQLALNLGWSALFFGLQRIDLAAVEIMVLLAAIAATGVMAWRIDRLAGALFIPYAAWVAYASALNISLWWLNPA